MGSVREVRLVAKNRSIKGVPAVDLLPDEFLRIPGFHYQTENSGENQSIGTREEAQTTVLHEASVSSRTSLPNEPSARPLPTRGYPTTRSSGRSNYPAAHARERKKSPTGSAIPAPSSCRKLGLWDAFSAMTEGAKGRPTIFNNSSIKLKSSGSFVSSRAGSSSSSSDGISMKTRYHGGSKQDTTWTARTNSGSSYSLIRNDSGHMGFRAGNGSWSVRAGPQGEERSARRTQRAPKPPEPALLGWKPRECKKRLNGTAEVASGMVENGTNIPKVEHRGITVSQLKEIVNQIRSRCEVERWTSTNPSRRGELLKPENVTLYDCMKHYVLPFTTSRQCSYVEAVATTEQVPRWFVSHWWGESVINFVTCIERHADDRAVDADTAYWVCAYAVNQHDVSGELGNDPRDSPFYRALQLTEGTISVLDRESICYTRIWCSFEVSLALKDFAGKYKEGDEEDRSYLYDVYTLEEDGKEAVGLTAGIAATDKCWRRWTHEDSFHTAGVSTSECNEQQWIKNKTNRESSFPLESCTKALEVRLETAEASRIEDKRRILNCISGNVFDIESEPPAAHPEYEKVNALLRGMFAASAYRRILETGGAIEPFRVALSWAPMVSLEISFAHCRQFRGEALHFAKALPISLEALDLEYEYTDFESSDEFSQFSHLCNVRSFRLSCASCSHLSCLNRLWEELGSLTKLRKLRLVFLPHKKLTSIDGLAKAIANMRELETLGISFDNLGYYKAQVMLAKTVAGGMKLANLYREVTGTSDRLVNGKQAREQMENFARLSRSGIFGCSLTEESIIKFCLILSKCRNLRNLRLGFQGPLSKRLNSVKTCDDLHSALEEFKRGRW